MDPIPHFYDLERQEVFIVCESENNGSDRSSKTDLIL